MSTQPSRQQDIVIYDGHNMPVLQNFGETKVFFAEQVHAVIEVKSNLSHGEIGDLIGKASSIHVLQPAGLAVRPQIPLFGFAYSSSMSLEQIRDYSQRQVYRLDRDWGISAIAILKDKDEATGLITNVESFSFGTIMLSPNRTDPIASVVTKSEGDTLLAFYLLLLEAIKLTEAMTVPPSYLQYANQGGLGTMNVRVGATGAPLLVSQKALSILRNAHNLTDREIIPAWRVIVELAQTAEISLIDDDMRFALGERLLVRPTPREVWDATESYKQGKASASEQEALRFLVAILQEAARTNSFVEIVPQE